MYKAYRTPTFKLTRATGALLELRGSGALGQGPVPDTEKSQPEPGDPKFLDEASSGSWGGGGELRVGTVGP